MKQILELSEQDINKIKQSIHDKKGWHLLSAFYFSNSYQQGRLNMDSNIKQKVLELLKPEQMVLLATSFENQPAVRPMTMIHNKERFYFATGSQDAKTKQITSNPKVELCLLIKGDNCTGYIRASGNMECITDNSIRKEIYDEASFLHHYWRAADDIDFILYHLQCEKIEYMKPGENLSQKFDWI